MPFKNTLNMCFRSSMRLFSFYSRLFSESQLVSFAPIYPSSLCAFSKVQVRSCFFLVENFSLNSLWPEEESLNFWTEKSRDVWSSLGFLPQPELSPALLLSQNPEKTKPLTIPQTHLTFLSAIGSHGSPCPFLTRLVLLLWLPGKAPFAFGSITSRNPFCQDTPFSASLSLYVVPVAGTTRGVSFNSPIAFLPYSTRSSLRAGILYDVCLCKPLSTVPGTQ